MVVSFQIAETIPYLNEPSPGAGSGSYRRVGCAPDNPGARTRLSRNRLPSSRWFPLYCKGTRQTLPHPHGN